MTFTTRGSEFSLVTLCSLVKMVVTLFFMLWGIFYSSYTQAFEIPAGCLVVDQVEEKKLLFNTFEFSAAKDKDRKMQTKILLLVDRNNYTELQLNSSHVTVKTNQPQDEASNAIGVFDETSAWKRFQLGIVENITLHDDSGRSLLPKQISIGFSLKEIIISGGYFTRMCPQRTPTWQIEGEKGQEIPLQSTMTRHLFTLFSASHFTPIIIVCGTDLRLGMTNETLMIGDSAEPLPPGHQPIFFEFLKINGAYSMKVLDGHGNMILTTPINNAPTKFVVKGRKMDKFLVVQHLQVKEALEEKCAEVSMLLLMVAPVSIAVILFIQVADLVIILKPFSLRLRRGSSSSSSRAYPSTSQPQ